MFPPTAPLRIPLPGRPMTLSLRPCKARACRSVVAVSLQNGISIHQKAPVQCLWSQAAQAVRPPAARAQSSAHNSHSAADVPDRHTPQRTMSHTRYQSCSGKTACLPIPETVSAPPMRLRTGCGGSPANLPSAAQLACPCQKCLPVRVPASVAPGSGNRSNRLPLRGPGCTIHHNRVISVAEAIAEKAALVPVLRIRIPAPCAVPVQSFQRVIYDLHRVHDSNHLTQPASESFRPNPLSWRTTRPRSVYAAVPENAPPAPATVRI